MGYSGSLYTSQACALERSQHGSWQFTGYKSHPDWRRERGATGQLQRWEESLYSIGWLPPASSWAAPGQLGVNPPTSASRRHVHISTPAVPPAWLSLSASFHPSTKHSDRSRQHWTSGTAYVAPSTDIFIFYINH